MSYWSFSYFENSGNKKESVVSFLFSVGTSFFPMARKLKTQCINTCINIHTRDSIVGLYNMNKSSIHYCVSNANSQNSGFNVHIEEVQESVIL